MVKKISPLIEKELETIKACGKNFQIIEGTRHQKIYVQGVFCGILPKNGKSNTNSAELNVRAQIRRAVKEV